MNATIKHCKTVTSWLNMFHQKKKKHGVITLIHVCLPITHQGKSQQSILTPFFLMLGRQPNLPIDIDIVMQSEPIEDLHYLEMQESDNQAK